MLSAVDTCDDYAEVFKSALITPLLKESHTNSADPRSYRPISNLSVVSNPFIHPVLFLMLYCDICIVSLKYFLFTAL